MKFISRLLLTIIVSVLISFAPAANAMASDKAGSSGDLVKVIGDIYVNEGTTVSGNVVAVKGNIYINGSVTGDAVAVFGDIIVNGKVLGDTTSVAGKITVGENGKVLGSTVEALGGSFGGGRRSYNNNPIPNMGMMWGRTTGIFFSFFGAFAIFLVASLVYIIMPLKVEEMANSIEPNIGKRLGIGVLTIFASPIAMIILTIALAITIIGILVIPFAWIAFLIAGLIALVPVYVYIGKKIVALTGNRDVTNYAGLASGVFIVWAIKTIISFGGIFTVWISAIISFGIFALGIGTLIDYLFTKKNKLVYANYPSQGGGYNQYNQPMQDSNDHPHDKYVPETQVPKSESADNDTQSTSSSFDNEDDNKQNS